MSYFLSCQILENKVRSPVSKKINWVEGTFTFSFLAMIIHRVNSQYWIVKDVKDGVSCISYWQAGLGIVQCCIIVPSLDWNPLLEKSKNRASFLPHNFPAVLIIFVGRGREPPPHSAERGGEPLPPRRAGRSFLNVTTVLYLFNYKDVTTVLYLLVKDLDLCCSGF